LHKIGVVCAYKADWQALADGGNVPGLAVDIAGGLGFCRGDANAPFNNQPAFAEQRRGAPDF
jgi:hypothetical protein